MLEAELKSERGTKADMEQQLVSRLIHAKVRHAESLEREDCMEHLIEHYEEQLQALNPAFKPVDPERFWDAQFQVPLISPPVSMDEDEKQKGVKRPILNKSVEKLRKLFRGSTG